MKIVEVFVRAAHPFRTDCSEHNWSNRIWTAVIVISTLLFWGLIVWLT